MRVIVSMKNEAEILEQAWLHRCINRDHITDEKVWSVEEDKRLLHVVKLLPNNWKTIAPLFGVTTSQCKEHYDSLVKEARTKYDVEEPAEDPQQAPVLAPFVLPAPVVGESNLESVEQVQPVRKKRSFSAPEDPTSFSSLKSFSYRPSLRIKLPAPMITDEELAEIMGGLDAPVHA